MKINQKGILLVTLIIVIPGITILASMAAINTQATITVNQSSILNTPFYVQYNGFDVHDGVTDSFIKAVPAGQQFVDATYTYPKVDAYFSQPFLVTGGGAYTATAPPEYLDAIGTIVVDGVVYYVHSIRYGIDVGVRTSGNMKPAVDTTSMLAPFAGFSHTHRGGTHVFQRLDTTYPTFSCEGLLAGYVDTGLTPWVAHYAARNAKITSSLEKIDFFIGSESSRYTTRTYDNAINTLKTNYGNSKVNVYPRITLQSKPDFFTSPYTFNAIIGGENVTVTVNPTTTQTGFENLFKNPTYDRKGAITNTLQEELAAANISSPIPETNPTATRANDVNTDAFTQNPGYVNTRTITGGIAYVSSSDQVVTGFSDPFGSISTNLTWPASVVTVDASTSRIFNNFQKTVTIKAGNCLQPVTKITTATMRVAWQMRFWDGDFFLGEDTETGGFQDIKVPCGITTTNLYSQQRVIIETVVLTSASMSMLSASGEPIDPSTFTDYQLNQIIRDPTTDVVEQDVTQSWFDWGRWWQDVIASLGSGLGIFGSVAVVVVVLVLGWYFKGWFRAGKPVQTGGNNTSHKRKSWSITRKGFNYTEA